MVISPDGKSLILNLSYRTARQASTPALLRPIVTPMRLVQQDRSRIEKEHPRSTSLSCIKLDKKNKEVWAVAILPRDIIPGLRGPRRRGLPFFTKGKASTDIKKDTMRTTLYVDGFNRPACL